MLMTSLVFNSVNLKGILGVSDAYVGTFLSFFKVLNTQNGFGPGT